MSTRVESLGATANAWLWLGVPALGALLLYAPVLPSLVHEWATFPSLSHGFAIPLIAAYIVWARRDRLAVTPLVPSPWGVLLLGGGLAVLVVGIRGGESFIARVSLPMILLGIALFVGGWRITRELAFGVAYLVFMIPLPWATIKLVTYRSRMLDASVSATALGWLGVPVHHDGPMLALPNMVLEVADECSSIPAIAALLALGVAYASTTSRPLASRLLLVLAALPCAIASNIIRITTTAAAVYYLGPWTLHTVYHQFNGTVNFMITFALLLAVDGAISRIRWRRSP